MKTFKHLFLITSLLLFGGFLLASDTGKGGTETEDAKKVDPSNPPECETWECDIPPVKNSDGKVNLIRLACNEDLPNINKPDVMPDIIDGQAYCVEKPEITKDITVSYTWKLEGEFKKGVPGLQQLKLIGTATLSSRECSVSDSDFDVELDVNVITEGMFLALPNKLINCDEVNFFVIGGTPKFTFKVEPNIADIKGNARNGFTIQANGSGLGKATVTVTDKNGCEDVAEIDVAACDFIEPSILAGAHYVGLECVTNVPGREPFNCQMYEAVWDVGDGIEATCKDGEVVKTPIELNKGQIGPRFGKIFKWEVFGATIIGADDQKFVTIENCDENTIISVTISEKYEACEEIHTASDEAIRAGRDSSKKVGLKGAGGQEPNYFNPSNKYASVNLHGKPSSIISPQSETEKDTTRAGFSVDTYNLSPSFSAVDVSIPLQGTDLRLEMKRTNSFDVTNPNQDGNTDNLPGKTILGRTWRTNIAPMVYLKESTRVKNLKLTPVPPCSPELDQPKPGNQSKSIIVHDENGSTFRYNHATLEPEKQSFGDPESALHKLEETPTGYIFTKKNGTVLIFDFLDLNLPETERLGSFADFKVSVSKFARAKSVTDRNGNTLIYEYPLDTVTALPERIYYEQNNKISLKFGYDPSRTKLLNVTDPLNKVTSYEYENDFLHKVIRPEVEIFDPLTKSTSFHSPETVYDYTSIAYKSGNQKLDSVNHAISSITDPEGNVISLTYDTKAIGGQEPLRFTGALVQSPGGGQIFASALEDPQSEVIVTVSTLTSPDGVVEFSLESATDLDRKTVVKDTSGYRWIYNFTVTENDFTVKEGPPLVGGGISLLIGGGEKLLDKFTRTVVDHDSKIKTMTAKFGTNEAHTINLKEVVDYYGNITKYEYGIQPVTFFRTNKDTGEVTKVTEDYDFGRFNQPFREIRDATPIDGDPNDHLNITQEFGYEPKYNQMVRIVDELGNVTTYNIDNEGNRLQAIAPNDKVTTFTYEKGYQTSATDADGRKTVSHRIYDETGWTDTSTIKGYNNELSITTVKQYDLVGNLKQITDGNGNTTKHYYDDTHMLEKTELPPVEDFDSEEAILQRPTINFKRDKNRQIVGKQDARGNWTLTEYDDMLRPETVTIEVAANEAENISTTTIYDEGGNKSIFTDAIGTVYKFEYDVFNNLIKEIKDFGNGEEFQNLISTFEYGENSGSDLFGSSNFAPTKKVDPEGLSSVLEYDNVYRLVSTKAGYQFREQLLSEIVYNNVGNVVKTTTYNDRVSNLDGEYEFDSQSITLGNRETITLYDDLNRKTATAIDLDGDGASIEDPDDIVTNFFYDLSGNIVIVVDPEGHVTQTEYDGAGRVVKEVVNLDDEPQYEEVNGNQHTIIPQEDDIVTTKSYDNNNNILTVTLINDTEGASGTQTITNTYDALNRIKAVKDPEGYSTEKKYDLNNNIRYVKNSRGVETESEYDEANRLIRQIFPLVFDAEANNGLGVNVQPEVLNFYDTKSNIIKKIDPRGLISTNTYDSLNRLIESRKIVGEDDKTSGEDDDIVSQNFYNKNSNLIETKLFRDDTVLINNIEFDSLNRPYVTKDSEGFKSVSLYDLVGNKVKIFDKRSNTKIIDGKEVKDEVPQLRYFTQVTFDLANRMVKNTLPEIPVATRNEFGDVNVDLIQPFSEVIYLKNNWVDKTIDLNGNETSTVYDNAGRTLSVTNAIRQTISYSYDKAGNVLTQIVENNDTSGGDQVTSYSYDKRNLLLTETLNKDHATLERTYEYKYDENGNKRLRVFPNGNSTTYAYDPLDRLASEVYTEANEENKTYKYNNNGAVVNCTDNTGTVKYKYDILGRQITETKLNSSDAVVSVVESVYDKANNRIRCFFPNNKKTLVSLYDKRNLLITMKGYHGKVLPDDEETYPGQAEVTSYIYNANGSQVSCTLPNGQTTTKEFDEAERTSKTTTSAQVLTETVNSYSAEYKRDAVGNQLQTIETRSVANGNGTRTRTLNFIYDAIYQLTVESDDLSGETVVNTYIYDLQGNRQSRIQQTEGENDQDSWIYTNDLLNQTTTVQIDLKGIDRTSSYTYQYDDNGNRKLRTFIDEDSETSTHTYSYDQENRLINVNDGSDDIFKASYDYRTRRTAKTEVNAQDQFETVSYIYDGGVSCQEVKVTTSGDEYDGTNGSLDKQYIRGNGMGGGIGSVCYMERPADFADVGTDVQSFYDTTGYGPTDLNGSSNMLAEYYAYNAVGSIVANTDQDGYVIRENDFDAYGRVVRTEDHTPNNFPEEFGGSSNDLLFSTKERDYSTGLDNFGFRYYDSVLGKFITRDPSGYPDGPNNYLYCKNNPINCIDPLGLVMVYEDEAKAELELRQEVDPDGPWDRIKSSELDGSGSRYNDVRSYLRNLDSLLLLASKKELDGNKKHAKLIRDFVRKSLRTHRDEIIVETTYFAKIAEESKGHTISVPKEKIPYLITQAALLGSNIDPGSEMGLYMTEVNHAIIGVAEGYVAVKSLLNLGKSVFKSTKSAKAVSAGAEEVTDVTVDLASSNLNQYDAHIQAYNDLPTFRLSKSDPAVADSAQVIEDAINAGQPHMLSRGAGRRASDRNRYNSQKEIRAEQGPPARGYNYDEFPFASTNQGGVGAYIREILAGPNQEAGRRLGRFLEGTGEYSHQTKLLENDWFKVQIDP